MLIEPLENRKDRVAIEKYLISLDSHVIIFRILNEISRMRMWKNRVVSWTYRGINDHYSGQSVFLDPVSLLQPARPLRSFQPNEPHRLLKAPSSSLPSPCNAFQAVSFPQSFFSPVHDSKHNDCPRVTLHELPVIPTHKLDQCRKSVEVDESIKAFLICREWNRSDG